jgi:tRNA (guanine26-N2/guanine27-N2)-dimethyltransferase
MKLKKIQEGKAQLRVPAQDEDIFHQPIFFNPVMSFNRSVSSIALGCSRKSLPKKPLVLDGLCGIGSRGVRYSLENKGLEKVFLVDANPDAIKVAKENVKLNKISKTCFPIKEDLGRFLANFDEKFDFIELDPFGSPVEFLENAIRAASDSCVLSVTATDLATLAGSRPKPALRRYDSRNFRGEFSHESALRILLGRIARTARSLDFGLVPLISFYKMHFVKCIALLEKSADEADLVEKNLGFVNYCFKCGERNSGKLPLATCGCGNKFDFAGPLWVSQICDGNFLKEIIAETRKRNYLDESERCEIGKLLNSLIAENDFPPFFFDVHEIAGKRKKQLRKMEEILESLRSRGFKAERTHYASTGIKTNAGIDGVTQAL